MISSNNTLENPELKMAVLMLAILQNRHRSIENHINKFGISIKFFKKHYLRSDTIFNNDLKEPVKNFNYLCELLICKIKLFYLKLLN